MRRLFHAPLFWLVLPFAAGIILCERFVISNGCPMPSADIFFLLLFLPFAGFLCLFFLTRRAGADRRHGLRFSLLFVMAMLTLFAAGFCHCLVHEQEFRQVSDRLSELVDARSSSVVTMAVTGAPVKTEAGAGFMVELISIEYPGYSRPVSGRVAMSVRGGDADLFTPGDLLRARVFFRPVSNFNTPGTFDYVNWWKLRGVAARGYVRNPLEIVRTGEAGGDLSCMAGILVERLRQKIMQAVERAIKDSDTGAVALALLVGEKGRIDSRIRDAFSASGLGHLLAVSGIHMAMAAFAAGFLARLFFFCLAPLSLRLPVRQTVVAAGALSAVCYAALAGFSPSATRAMIMIVAFALAWIAALPMVHLNTLSLAAWILLLLNPFYLFDISFRFSFTVVFFLVAASEIVTHPARIFPDGPFLKILEKAAGVIVVTLVASLAAWPISAWYFNHVSMISLLSNLVAVPLTGTLVLPLLLSGGLLSLICPAAGYPLLSAAGGMISLLTRTALFSAGLPLAHRWVIPPALPSLLFYYAGLFIFLWLAGRRWVILAVFLLVSSVALLFFHPFRQPGRDGTLAVHFPDVGQGTCQVVVFPDGAVMVMDSGGFRNRRFDTGKRIVAPFLRRQGIEQIDLMVVSHPEIDHFGGFEGLLETFSTGEIWHNVAEGQAGGGFRWRMFLKTAEGKGVAIRLWQDDAEFVMHGATFRLFTGNGCEKLSSSNDRSLVLALSWHGNNILFTGDIGRRREACFVEKWKARARYPGRVDILAVPHHGSNTSSGRLFLDALNPVYAVIPVGGGNHLGLPDHDVVERLRMQGAQVLRTDHNGTISFYISEKGIDDVSFFRF